MTEGTMPARAWATHAPADYMMVFEQDPDGEEAVVNASFRGEEERRSAAAGLEGVELSVGGTDLSVYCTLPGEPEEVLATLEGRGGVGEIERGRISMVAVGDAEGTSSEAADGRRSVEARVVVSFGGAGPRIYRPDRECERCGEFLGKILVLPRGPVSLDSRLLKCRCTSIPCRYCGQGRVRRPLTEHFDPERRSGHVPWFGYLVPCGSCQVAGRGPRVILST